PQGLHSAACAVPWADRGLRGLHQSSRGRRGSGRRSVGSATTPHFRGGKRYLQRRTRSALEVPRAGACCSPAGVLPPGPLGTSLSELLGWRRGLEGRTRRAEPRPPEWRRH
ncbi:unnamed protein product, partial [Polarella glacialis]